MAMLSCLVIIVCSLIIVCFIVDCLLIVCLLLIAAYGQVLFGLKYLREIHRIIHRGEVSGHLVRQIGRA